MRKIRELEDVTAWRLCLGCGACSYACTEKRVHLVNEINEGIRPVVDLGHCTTDCDCLRVCPVVQSDFAFPSHDGLGNQHSVKWGPVLEIWEGHASDPGIRYRGSSGGALTAIAAYCVELGGMHGVLHTGQDPQNPLLNRTRLSRNRAELLVATGSRYSPASVCDRLDLVEEAPGTCAVIGKPVEISALRNAQKLRPRLDAKVGVALSFFCAETPSTRGTVSLLAKLGVSSESLADLRYRGIGWPGHFTARIKGESQPRARMSYRESWAFLQAYRPWAVQMWPDGTGELADISCGDPWYAQPDGKNPGFSLVVVRTRRGQEVIRGAMEAGYLELQRAEDWKLEKSQSGLIEKKGSVWGRRVAMRLLGLPVTRFNGLDLFYCWRGLSLLGKLKSLFGTLRRVVQRRYYFRRVPNPMEGSAFGIPP